MGDEEKYDKVPSNWILSFSTSLWFVKEDYRIKKCASFTMAAYHTVVGVDILQVLHSKRDDDGWALSSDALRYIPFLVISIHGESSLKSGSLHSNSSIFEGIFSRVPFAIELLLL